ncbi:MAG: periplasmic heavy metal sensor [Chlorobium sp.]
MNFISSKRLVSIALVLLALCNVMLLCVLWLQNSHRLAPFLPQRHHNGRPNSFLVTLGLTESQNLTFRKLREEHFLKVRPEMETITVLKRQLVEESLKDHPDGKKIETIAAGIGFHQTSIERELASHFHELAKVCTPEQRNSLKKALDRIATGRHSMRMERSIGPQP